MGYRPTIVCEEKEIELGKFYGYVELEGLESIKWLIEHNKINEDEVDMFNYLPFEPIIHFTAEEFRDFIDLYEKDINNYNRQSAIKYPVPNYKISDWYPDFLEIYDNNSPKTIEWG